MARLKLLPGGKVRLLRDIQTNGGTIFRAGLVMYVNGTERGVYLSCQVRARHHGLTLKLNEEGYLFVVIAEPKPEDT